MQDVALQAGLFEGAVSVEHTDQGWKPWRLPHARKALFPCPDDALLNRAEDGSGVRLRLATDAVSIRLEAELAEQVNPATGRDSFVFDLTVNGGLIRSCPVGTGRVEAVFDNLPAESKVVEIWLPQDSPCVLERLQLNDAAGCAVLEDPRPRWVTYGSSLTHCVRAHSPARTWPAIIARRYHLNLTCLGFGGHCCLDPMLGFVMRDLPADFFTLKLGINCIGPGHLSARTYPGAALGLVRLIRDRHPHTPVVLVSPIGHPPLETTPSCNGYTISGMRRDLKDVCARLAAAGDRAVHYADGLEVFSLEEIEQWTVDQCHPNADGIELMADNFDRAVMQRFYATSAH